MGYSKNSKKIGWNFDNTYVRLPKVFYTEINPTPVSNPKLVILNYSLANTLGLDIQGLESEEGVSILSGNKIPEGAFPIAQAYAGHQFGYFTMLGDGRAVLLGEHITPDGKRFDIQLKGSGRTPYSRRGDGKAVLGPMLREYIISEAMNALGVPTTRSLAVVTTGDKVMREKELPGAVLTRVAASHIRVGTFEYIAKWGTVEELKMLADYAIRRHYPEVEEEGNKYLSFLNKVVERQASLIAKWQLIGFVHGVMNTDNMTISGETIDYGPCAFMDVYDPETVFSSIDYNGRYAYGNQPDMAAWNLKKLAESLLPLIHQDREEAVKIAEKSVSDFFKLYYCNWLSGMKAKLGIFDEETEDKNLIKDLLNIMKKYKADYTSTFRGLTLGKLTGMTIFETTEFAQWYEMWKKRIGRQQGDITPRELMLKNNPSVIPRNYKVEEALDAAVRYKDYSIMKKLIKVLLDPFNYSCEQGDYTKLPPPSTKPYRTFCGT